MGCLFAPCAIRLPEAPEWKRDRDKYGFSTRKFLGDLNFDELEIEAMIRRWIASEEWSEVYLPE